MFRRRLTLALSLLAVFAVLSELGAAAALAVAERHVQRGRVASDIQLAFVELSATKQRLRTWVAQLQQGAEPDPAQRQALQREMRDKLRQLDRLSERAASLGTGEDSMRQHVERQQALQVLADSVRSLEAAVDAARPLTAGADAREAWRALSSVFDRSQGQDLRLLLADSIQREAAAVARERAAADTTLAWIRAAWMAMALMLAGSGLAAAVYFARALRRPLDELAEGAQALQRGELQHRIPLAGGDEFAVVARSMNAMAEELDQHRRQEDAQRRRLEDLVGDRTAELEQALEALRLADERRRRLFADISHELRTPTTAIRGEAEVTLRGRDRPVDEYRSALGRIVQTSQQLGLVIDDLLAMARSDLDALTLVTAPLDLAEPLAEAVAQARALGSARQVAVQPLAEGAGPWPILGDAQRLRQLLLVLLKNAVDYSHPGGRVQVSARRLPPSDGDLGTEAAAQVEVTVRDDGIGLAEDERTQLFERHFRGTRARQHRAEGSGLGLAIARTLAQAHGGSVALMPAPGGGTVATVCLPLLGTARPEERPGEPARRPA